MSTCDKISGLMYNTHNRLHNIRSLGVNPMVQQPPDELTKHCLAKRSNRIRTHVQSGSEVHVVCQQIMRSKSYN